MAEGRMLKRVVAQSRKVNRLSLKATILWTWCIAFQDSEGYIEVEPDFLKLNVVPARKDISEQEIPGLVQEIAKIGLWKLFRNKDGKLIAKEIKFLQKIRKDKEAPSSFDPRELRECSGSTPGVLHPNIIEEKLIKENLNKGKGRECEGNQNQDHPVDNSPDPDEVPFEPPEQKDPLPETDKGKDQEQKLRDFEHRFHILQNRLLTKWPRFNLQLFFQNNFQKNRDAIIHALQQTLDRCTSSDPRTYAQKVLDIESGNFNEAETVKQAQENKNVFASIIDGLKKIQQEKTS